jgi:hypothetical protein
MSSETAHPPVRRSFSFSSETGTMWAKTVSLRTEKKFKRNRRTLGCAARFFFVRKRGPCGLWEKIVSLKTDKKFPAKPAHSMPEGSPIWGCPCSCNFYLKCAFFCKKRVPTLQLLVFQLYVLWFIYMCSTCSRIHRYSTEVKTIFKVGLKGVMSRTSFNPPVAPL